MILDWQDVALLLCSANLFFFLKELRIVHGCLGDDEYG